MHIHDIRIGMEVFSYSAQRKAVVTSFGQFGVWLDGGTPQEMWADPQDLSLLSTVPQWWSMETEDMKKDSQGIKALVMKRIGQYIDVKAQCPSFRELDKSSFMGRFVVQTEQKFDTDTSLADVRESLAERIFEHMYGDLFDALIKAEKTVESYSYKRKG